MTQFFHLTSSEVVSKNYIGKIFAPITQNKLPGIIILPGSEGGIPEKIAKYVASHGYIVLAIGYFGLKDLPQYLENIPLETFQDALKNFKNEPLLMQDCISFLGYSRGAELALILGSFFPGIVNRIVAVVPSSVTFGAFPYINRPAWIYKKKPLIPFVKALTNADPFFTEREDLQIASEKGIIAFHENTEKDPYQLVDLFLSREKNLLYFSKCAIPVENLSSSLLLISAGQDKIWPSANYAEQIMLRLQKNDSKIERESIVYEEAGHGILAPYEYPIFHPIGKFWCTLGGTKENNQKAHEDAWQKIFRFLNNNKN